MRDLHNETDENRDTERDKNIMNEMSLFTTGLKEVRSQCIKCGKEMNSKSMLKHMCTWEHIRYISHINVNGVTTLQSQNHIFTLYKSAHPHCTMLL